MVQAAERSDHHINYPSRFEQLTSLESPALLGIAPFEFEAALPQDHVFLDQVYCAVTA